ncbi:MAG TPA: hypothetical protein VKV20_08375 [Ktedonobacteraceae bacterium]|nr:hypothetical protein [Ktedonobacteraceae bacterium]
MNCIQAQAMLAAYRDLKKEDVDTLELDVHLEHCASCREALARFSFIGEQVRSLPVIETPPEMHTSLMRTLAKEQLRHMQRSAPGAVSTPEFLRPYLQEQSRTPHVPASISALSSAQTGPLPIIRAKTRSRHMRVNQFAVLGIAAMFLMLLMMSGITSLLLLAHSNSQVASTVNTVGSKAGQSIVQQSELTTLRYTTSTVYQNVVSATAVGNDIYYTAYSNDATNEWMLEKLDRTTMQSTNLLANASTHPLIVLGANNDWLVWLQYDDLKSAFKGHLPNGSLSLNLHAWSLHYLALTPQAITSKGKSSGGAINLTPTASQGSTGDSVSFPAQLPPLIKGVFNRSTAPLLASSPVQGVWFIQNSLLVAMIDTTGTSRLLRFELDTNDAPASVKVMATAPAGEILASPTANSDGSQIFWSEEWLSQDGNLHSNIWIQQMLDTQPQSRGKVAENTVPAISLYRSDGLSFSPQVVDDTLFLLNTASTTNSGQIASRTVTPLNLAAVPRIDTSVSAEPLDTFVQGTVLMIPLDGDSANIPVSLGTGGQSSALQAGNNFVLWQDNDGYKMYDVQTASDVVVGQVLNGANFVAVNGNTAIWTASNNTVTPSTTSANTSTTLLAFNWGK